MTEVIIKAQFREVLAKTSSSMRTEALTQVLSSRPLNVLKVKIEIKMTYCR